MKKENAITIVQTIIDLFIWYPNNHFSIVSMDKGRTKIVPEDKTYILELILNRTESEVFFESNRVKRVRGNDYIIVPKKPDNSTKVTAKEPKQTL